MRQTTLANLCKVDPPAPDHDIREECELAWLLTCLKHGAALSMTDCTHLKRVFKRIGKDATQVIGNRNRITERTLPSAHTFVQASIDQQITDDQATSFSITSDGWTGRLSRKYITITLHYVSKDMKMKNFCFEFTNVTVPQTGINLCEFFRDRVMARVNDNMLLHGIVVDNGANFKLGATLVQGEDSVMPCFAHTLQLCVHDVVGKEPWIRILSDTREIVKQVRNNSAVRNAYNVQCRAENLEAVQLIEDNATRWSSEFDMVTCLLK